MVDYSFLFIQGIDIVAWVILFVSYYQKNTNNVILFQIFSTILFILHYWLLGAYSGSLICLFEVFRDCLYCRTWIDLFPILSSLIDGYSLTFSHKKIVVIGGFFSYFLWIIYDFFVGSYTGMITDSLIVISNACILLFNKNGDGKLFRKI